MHPSNPPPLNNVPPSKRTSVVFEPYALHMIASVIRDLQFLRQQGYISFAALEEIIERLPKPVVHAAPHTPPAPSPSSSPIPQPESPTVSIKSDISQKRNSNTSISQRPPSTSSQNLQQQQQQQQQQLQQQEEQTLHSLTQDNSVAEEENQSQQLQQKSARRQSPTTTPQQINTTPPPLHNSSPPSQSQLQQNDDDVVNAGHPQLESIPKPAVPSRASVYQPVSPIPSPQSGSNISLNTSSNTISSTGAILATRPLPLPPNAPNSSPPRPQPLPIFNNKYEEAEYEKSINQQQQLKDTVLPAYSLSIVEAMWDFVGDDAGDLSFKKGDIVEVVEYVNMDWWRGRIQGTGNIGIFPKIYTKILNTQPPLNQVIPDQPVANNTAYYNQRLPQHSNNMTPYSSQHYQLSQSPSQLPSQLQHQQLPPTQQQLPPTQQNYTTYQHHPSSVQTVYDSVYANHASNIASQHHYLNTRSSTTSLNNQQQYYNKYS